MIKVYLAENKRKRKVLNWDNENDRERLLQQQARKDLKESKSIKVRIQIKVLYVLCLTLFM